MSIELSQEQQHIINYIMSEMKRCNFSCGSSSFRDLFNIIVGGYAGTGKTTLLAFLRKEIKVAYPNLSVALVTYTGKASSLLKSKMESNYVDLSRDFIGTIHSLIYKAQVRWDKKLNCHVIIGWKLKTPDEVYYDLIIIDEGSMVSKEIWDDLQKLEKPIIVMGDHGQLPPIGDSFNLMEHPHFKLNEIHRQALNSPIILLSKFVRDNGYIPFNTVFSKGVFKISWNHNKCKELWDSLIFDENIIVLCAFNSTRCELNSTIRNKLDFKEKIPCPSERIICLQNDHVRGIMNGQIATLIWIMPEGQDLYRMTLNVDGYNDYFEAGAVSDKCFGQVTYTMYDKSEAGKKQYNYAVKKGIAPINYFDYGYAISVHKSQGSEWNKVVLFEQRTKHWDDQYYARWLYTAITRAKEKLFIISDYW